MKQSLIILSGLVLFVGCSSFNINRYYVPIDGVSGIAFEGEPIIEARSGDLQEDIYLMMASNYVAIGVASFTGKEYDRYYGPIWLLAKNHKAERVFTYSRYNRTETESGALPVTTYSTTMVPVTGGYGGFHYATVMAPTTTYMPYSSSVDVYNHDVVLYQRDPNPPKFGALFCDLDEDEARALESREYMKIKRVIRGKAAWKANLFGGDIILAVNGEKPTPERVRARADEGEVVLRISRDGKEMTVVVKTK